MLGTGWTIGPKTIGGHRVTRSKGGFSFLMKSHAASSANFFDPRYASTEVDFGSTATS